MSNMKKNYLFEADVVVTEVTREGATSRGYPFRSVRAIFSTAKRGEQNRILTAFGNAVHALPGVGESRRLLIAAEGGNLRVASVAKPREPKAPTADAAAA